MGVKVSCIAPQLSFLPKSVVDSALARHDFEALKTALASLSPSKLNRLYGDETLIQWAVKFQRVDVVELLLRLGANPDRTMKTSLSALTRAIILNNEEIFNALVEADCDPNLSSDDNVTPLVYAIIVNRPFAVTALLNHQRIELERADILGMTALHHACKCRSAASLQFVEQLLKAAARLDPRDKNGATPLHLAVRSPRKVAAICDYLRSSDSLSSNGTDLASALVVRDNGGLNVLHRALMKEENESAIVLLKNGAIFGVIPPVFVERVLTSVISANNPFVLRHLMLCLPDPTCCFFSSSVSPPAGLFDIAFTMRRFDVAARLGRVACLPKSRRPRSNRISTHIAEGFNSPPPLQSLARLAVRRSIRTSDPRRYETAVGNLHLPDELVSFLLFLDVEQMALQPFSTSALPDLAGLRRSDLIQE